MLVINSMLEHFHYTKPPELLLSAKNCWYIRFVIAVICSLLSLKTLNISNSNIN